MKIGGASTEAINRRDSTRLTQFQRAIGGRCMSQTMAYEIQCALGVDYQEGDKLSDDGRRRLQQVVDRMLANGVQPIESLLSPCQLSAQQRRKTT